MKRRVLGRGLDALIPEVPERSEGYAEVKLTDIVPNSQQPRIKIEEGKLEELADSIRQNGLVHPILVRRLGEKYQIIAGERRWLAARRAGLERIPAIIKDLPEDKLLELALVENIQREDLNPIEEALAYQRLLEMHRLKQEELAARIGKDRVSIANALRLLKLPEKIRGALEQKKISAGHAKALLALPSEQQQVALCEKIIAQNLSVRETERLAREMLEATGRARAAPPLDPNVAAAEERLRLRLGTKVKITRRARGGTLLIEFYSDEELHRIYSLIMGE